MQPARIENHTRSLGKPSDWDDAQNGHCGTLYVRDEQQDGINYMTSHWDVDAREAVRLLTGGRLKLSIAGQAHPVVGLGVTDPPEDYQPLVLARPFVMPNGQRGVRVEAWYPPGQGCFSVASLEEHDFPTALAAAMQNCEAYARQQGWIE